MSNATFMDRVLAGEVLDLREIDDEIARWHRGSSTATLHESLGLTWQEYQLFVERPEVLPLLAQARKYGLSIVTLVGEQQPNMALAARGASPQELVELRRWLKATGRL